ALQKSGKLAEAQEVYESIRDREPENRAAAVELLRVYERSRQLDRAIPILEEFVKSQPGNIGIKTEYAVMLLRVRRFADSARVFEEVLKADPGNKEALRYYASLLSEQQKIDEADAILKRLEAVDPDDLDASYRRGINFLEARRLDEAEKVLLGLREKAAKQSKSKDGAELAQIDGQLGYVAYLRKDYALARKRVQPVLFTKDPDEVLNGQAFNLLAQIARDDEKPAEGLALVREVLAKVPEEKRAPALVGAHGEFLARSSDPKDQAEGDKVLAALAAKDRLGALAAADAWQRLEKHDKAVATAKIGLQATPNDPDLLFRLAASLERDKKIPEAVAAFEKLLAVRPDHAPALNYVGYMWAERNENLDKARAYIQKAVDLEPGNGAYLDSLGWVYFQLGQLDNAEKYLKDAARLNPDDSAIEDHLGDLYAKKGDLVKARAAFTRALALKPEDGGEKLRKKLSALEGKVEATRK
ncbi:MAG: tetratricopeptide repeat protein, partial [Acidobacteria bacterium]|nr:tetratricopeptide repeat protein [Acidobacteriota bacterium]